MATQTITKEDKEDNLSECSSPSLLVLNSYPSQPKKEENETCRSLTPLRNRQMQSTRTSAVDDPVQVKPYLF